jgi:hypothetical protein
MLTYEKVEISNIKIGDVISNGIDKDIKNPSLLKYRTVKNIINGNNYCTYTLIKHCGKHLSITYEEDCSISLFPISCNVYVMKN